jgi:hypothetical protein
VNIGEYLPRRTRNIHLLIIVIIMFIKFFYELCCLLLHNIALNIYIYAAYYVYKVFYLRVIMLQPILITILPCILIGFRMASLFLTFHPKSGPLKIMAAYWLR